MAKAASCEGVVTECEFRDALRQVGLNKSPGVDVLPYEVYYSDGYVQPLQVVISDLIGPEQTYAVKRRSIQDNFHLIRGVLEGIRDGTEAVLINLDQSKAFDKVDHQFLGSVLETAGFQPEFCRWVRMMYHNPQAVM